MVKHWWCRSRSQPPHEPPAPHKRGLVWVFVNAPPFKALGRVAHQLSLQHGRRRRGPLNGGRRRGPLKADKSSRRSLRGRCVTLGGPGLVSSQAQLKYKLQKLSQEVPHLHQGVVSSPDRVRKVCALIRWCMRPHVGVNARPLPLPPPACGVRLDAPGQWRGPPQCGPDTEQWNRGAPLAQPPEGKQGGVGQSG